MVKRRAFRLFSLHWLAGAGNRRSMALSKILLPIDYYGLSTLRASDEKFVLPRRGFVEPFCGLGATATKGVLRSQSCLDRNKNVFRKVEDGLRNPRAVAPYLQPLREAEIKAGMELGGAKLVNGRQGNLGFFNGPGSDKLVVAVDVDEVLGSFLAALNKFIADNYCAHHSLSEFYVYEFFKIWNCSPSEADLRVHKFFKTIYFEKGIQPIPGARRVLHRLAAFCNLSIVTSRQNIIKDHTIKWIEEHYPGLFKDIHFGNHFALDGKSRPKSEICRSLGAQVLIDDNPRYALECAEAGVRVLLFDYHNSYPWSKCEAAASHPLVTKVHSWDEVESSLASFIVL